MNSDEVNISSWVELYGNDLYSWAYYKTSNKELAEDLVQDTFLAAHKAIQTFKKESNPKTWLFTILNNKIIDYFRSAAHKRSLNQIAMDQGGALLFDEHENWHQQSISDWNEEKHLLDSAEFLEVLRSCLDALPEMYKAVTMAKFFYHKKGDTICKELDISSSNLWQIVHRSKQQLKKCIDTHWKEDE